MKNKKYPFQPTEEQLKIMKYYWRMFRKEEILFNMRIRELEEKMSLLTGINDLEFFISDGEYVGIGNIERTMKLHQREELEDETL